MWLQITRKKNRELLFTVCLLIPIAVYWVFSQSQLQVGYVEIEVLSGRAPAAAALFSFRNASGVLVSEAAVEAVQPIRRGRVFVDQESASTGIALANPGGAETDLTLVLRDSDGQEEDRVETSLGAGEKLALLVNDVSLFPDLAADFVGSVTFETPQGSSLAAVTLRQGLNPYGEPLLATLPVVDLDGAAGQFSSESIVFPQVGGGGALSTQIILLNPSSERIAGEIQLISAEGSEMTLELDGVADSVFSYDLPPNGVFRGTLSSSSETQSGYAVVTRTVGPTPPAGTAIFQFRDGAGRLTSEAGVGAVPATTRFRVFVDTVSETQTGVAVASFSNPGAQVRFQLLDRRGAPLQSTDRWMPAGGQLSVLADGLFSSLPSNFSGLLEVSSSVPLSPITLKLTQNERGDLILTTLPVADLTRFSPAKTLLLPHVAFGFGFSTRLIVINTDTSGVATGRIHFLQSDGSALTLPMGGIISDTFPFEIPAGASLNLRPGNDASITSILIDPLGDHLGEITVNQGDTVQLTPLAVDSSGEIRDDFAFNYTVLDGETADVDASGLITGRQPGFSTLAVSSGGAVATATLTVVGLGSGISGAGISGITQDLGGRIFLADSQMNTILSADDIDDEPDRYAGVSNQAGLRDSRRLDSLFRGPSFLALDQSQGNLYVSDSNNHTVRKVLAGTVDRVESLAGKGIPGSEDGVSAQAAFNRPGGLALDSRGYLWVADRGNHTIRRVHLTTRRVETIAGSPGQAGNTDGQGRVARFSSPAGIAVEPEPLAEQLKRETLGEPPPPVSLIVADAGNNLLRRVYENGAVESVGVVAPLARLRGKVAEEPPRQQADPPVSSVAVDPFGNIYASQGQEILILLTTGQITRAVAAGTFLKPTDLSISPTGRLVIADERLVGELRYGEPVIDEVQPNSVSTRGWERIRISGRNFAPETAGVISTHVITGADLEILDTQNLEFKVPAGLPSGRITLTILNRGGLAQGDLFIQAPELSDLETGQITTLAGGSTYAGDGGPAMDSVLRGPSAVAVDSAGNIFLSDTDQQRIRRIHAGTEIINSIAGTGSLPASSESLGDGGLAPAASLAFPRGITIGPSGDIYFAEEATHRIRRIDVATGTISTVAGGGTPPSGASDPFGLGDGEPAVQARLNAPRSVLVDEHGALYIADTGNHRIRRVDSDGVITTIAGNSVPAFAGDGGPARSGSLSSPSDLALAPNGSLYITDSFNNRIRRVSPDGKIQTVVGPGSPGSSAAVVLPGLASARGLAVDGNGNLLIADTGNHVVRRFEPSSGRLLTVAGTGTRGFSGDGFDAARAMLNSPNWIAVDGSGNLLIADTGNGRLRKVDKHSGNISTIAGAGREDFLGDGGPAGAATLRFPSDIGWLSDVDLLIADTANQSVRLLDLGTGTIDSLVGPAPKTVSAQSTSLAAQIAADLSFPGGLVSDLQDTVFLSDTHNHRLIRIHTREGTVDTLLPDPLFDEFLPSLPKGLTRDSEANLYVADTGNHRVLRLATDGTVTIAAGTGEAGVEPFEGLAAEVPVNSPSGVTVDTSDNLYISDSLNHRICKVDAVTGFLSVVAGTGSMGSAGDGGPAREAELNTPRGLRFDEEGNLFLADSGNHRVRRIDARSGAIHTVAGQEAGGFAGDGGRAVEASLNFPFAIDFDPDGNLLVADQSNHRIRAVKGPGGSSGDEKGVAQLFALATVTGDAAVVGDILTYRIEVSNPGPDVAPNVQVTDVLPSELDLLSASSSAGQCQGSSTDKTVVCEIEHLGRSESAEILIEAAIPPSAVGKMVTNTVTCASDVPSFVPCLATTKSKILTRGLEMTKTGPETIQLPDQSEIPYVLNVTNNGPGTAFNVEVLDQLPAGTTLQSVTPSGVCIAQPETVRCNLGNMTEGQTRSVLIVASAGDSVTGQTVVNLATCNSPGADQTVPCTARAETLILGPESVQLVVTKQGPDQVIFSAENPQEMTYEIRLFNQGPGTAQEVQLTDLLPVDPITGLPAVTFKEVTPSSASCPPAPSQIGCCPGPGSVQCQLGNLAPGATAAVDLSVFPNASIVGRIAKNSVQATSAPTAAASRKAGLKSGLPTAILAEHAQDSAETLIALDSPQGLITYPYSDLTLTKEVQPSRAEPGSQTFFFLTVKNQGPTTASNVVVEDILDPQLTFLASETSQGSCSFLSGKIRCDLGILGNGLDLVPTEAAVTILVEIPTDTSESEIVNEATCHSDETDPTGCTASARLAIRPPNPPPLAFCKNTLVTATEGCSADASIDDWSYDLDGEDLTFSQIPPGPYGVGETFVKLIVTDEQGQSDSCRGIVIVRDGAPPVPNTTQLPELVGECSVEVSSQPTATDDCSGQIQGATTDPLVYSEAGIYTVHWQYVDRGGNVFTQPQTVSVIDSVAPVPDTDRLPILEGECSVDVASFPTATDNCAGTIAGTTSDPLTYNTVGTSSITWTYDDGNGNVSTQSQGVQVTDTVPPVPVLSMLPPETGECSVEITTVPVALDNCAGPVPGTTLDPLSYSSVGSNTVTWIYDDGNGNSTTQAQVAEVTDTVPPGPDLELESFISGECPFSPPVPTATDACEGTILGQACDLFIPEVGDPVLTCTYDSPPVFDSADPFIPIAWLYDDGNGNSSYQQQNIGVEDTMKPVPDVDPLPTLTVDSGTCCFDASVMSSECETTTPPTATDACEGAVTGSSEDFFEGSGTYVITWFYADTNDNVTTQSQTLILNCIGD